MITKQIFVNEILEYLYNKSKPNRAPPSGNFTDETRFDENL